MIFLIGAIGLVAGLVAHDLAIQSLDEERSLRPLTGICPRCHTDRGWLRLRCPECGRSAAREIVLVVVTATTAIGFAHAVGIHWSLLAYLGFLMLTASLLITDLEAFRIVNRLNLRGSVVVGVALAMAALLDGDLEALGRALLGAGAYFIGALLLWLLVRGKGFGLGDVKLAPQLGLFTAYLSWSTLGWAVFSTAILGGLFALTMMLFGRAGLKTELPYGPPMILGAWLAIGWPI